MSIETAIVLRRTNWEGIDPLFTTVGRWAFALSKNLFLVMQHVTGERADIHGAALDAGRGDREDERRTAQLSLQSDIKAIQTAEREATRQRQASRLSFLPLARLPMALLRQAR